MQNVALIDNHGVPDKRACRLLPNCVEDLDDAVGNLNGSDSLSLRESGSLIVVRPVAQASKRFEITSRLLSRRIGTIAEAKHKVLMRSVRAGYAEV